MPGPPNDASTTNRTAHAGGEPAAEEDVTPAPEPEPEAENGNGNGKAPLTTGKGWWATVAREWPDQDLISSLEDPQQRVDEAERIVMDWERQLQNSESYLGTLQTQAELNAEHINMMAAAAHTEAEDAYVAAIFPLRAADAFDQVKRKAVTQRTSILMQIAIVTETSEAATGILPALTSSGIAALPAPAEVSVPVASTGPQPAIEPPEQEEAAPLVIEPPTKEEVAQWTAWTTDPGSAPKPDTGNDLIPGMSEPGAKNDAARED